MNEYNHPLGMKELVVLRNGTFENFQDAYAARFPILITPSFEAVISAQAEEMWRDGWEGILDKSPTDQAVSALGNPVFPSFVLLTKLTREIGGPLVAVLRKDEAGAVLLAVFAEYRDTETEDWVHSVLKPIAEREIGLKISYDDWITA